MFMRRRRRYFLAMVLAIALVACAGDTDPPVVTGGMADATTSTPPTASYELANLVSDLGVAGLSTEMSDSYPPSLLTVPVQDLLVNGEPVSVHQYQDKPTAATEAGWISPSGDQISYPDPENPGLQVLTMMEPVATPHWFQHENIILLYVGDSPTTLAGLTAALGPQFAGGPMPPADAIPTLYRHTNVGSEWREPWQLPAPPHAFDDDVPTPPAWLAVPGQDTAVVGGAGSNEIEVRDGDTVMVSHMDAAPPGTPTTSGRPDAVPVVTLAEDELATIIIFIPYGAVQDIDVAFGDWPTEPVWPDLKLHLAGTAEQHGDFYAYTLEPAGQLVDQILLATVQFSHQAASGTVSFFWRLNPTPDQTTPDRTAADLAQETLVAFFDHLHDGRYVEAAELYGGSYEILVDWNPSLDPQDYAALLENGCSANGLECLHPISAMLQTSTPDAYEFLVEFEEDDGSLFTVGPCCGDDETTPPQSQFTYTVTADGGDSFLVQGLPPYQP